MFTYKNVAPKIMSPSKIFVDCCSNSFVASILQLFSLKVAPYATQQGFVLFHQLQTSQHGQ